MDTIKRIANITFWSIRAMASPRLLGGLLLLFGIGTIGVHVPTSVYDAFVCCVLPHVAI